MNKSSPASTKPAIIVTIAAFTSQILGFATSIITAYIFGASSDMDAYFAVMVLPQYLVSVFLGALSFVFIPAFVELKEKDENAAWNFASKVFNINFVLFFLLTVISILFSKELMKTFTPGMKENTYSTSINLAVIIWPTILSSSLIAILTGISHANNKFSLPAYAPLAGGFLYLILLIALGTKFGIIGLAAANLISNFIQALLLLPVLKNKWSFSFTLDHRIKSLIIIIFPLILSRIFVHSIPLIERFFASFLSEGSISHLGYAVKILSVSSLIISTGISTVLFTRMALENSRRDETAFALSISKGLRIMWLAAAPVILIGAALSEEIVYVLFQRGAFSSYDAAEVSSVLRIYLFALIGLTLAEVTSRTLYVLKKTKIIAVLSAFESFLYIFYANVLSNFWGTRGIALSFVILNTLSFLWQIILVKNNVRVLCAKTLIFSALRIFMCAAVSSIAAFYTSNLFSNIPGLIAGSAAGIVTYVCFLFILRAGEIKEIIEPVKEIFQNKSNSK